MMGPARRRTPDRCRARRRVEAHGVALLNQECDERRGDDPRDLNLGRHPGGVADRHRPAGVDHDEGLRLRGVDALARVQAVAPRRASPVDLGRVVALPIGTHAPYFRAGAEQRAGMAAVTEAGDQGPGSQLEVANRRDFGAALQLWRGHSPS